MANHPSAIKRARQSEARRLRNKIAKRRIKNVIKSVHAATERGVDSDTLAKELNHAKSVIAKSAKKGGIHKKTAARKTSRMERRVNAIKQSLSASPDGV